MGNCCSSLNIFSFYSSRSSSSSSSNTSSSSSSSLSTSSTFRPQPVTDTLPGVECKVTKDDYLSWGNAILYGFQHFIVVLGTITTIPSILVPLMGGGDEEKTRVIENMLFVSGLSTLLQIFFGTRLPVVMGSSWAFIIPAVSVAVSRKYSKEEPLVRFHHSMRSIQGGLFIGSLFQVLFGLMGFARIFGRYLNPLTAVPLVTLTGLGFFFLGFPLFEMCAATGVPALIILVIVSQCLSYWLLKYSKTQVFKRYKLLRWLESHRKMFELFPMLIALPFLWLWAEIMYEVAYKHRSHELQISCSTHRFRFIRAAPKIIRIPKPYQWGPPRVNVGDAFAMAAAAFVAIVESTGTFIAASRDGGATPLPPSVLSRGVVCQGICTFLHALFGSVTGSTASVDNAGLLGLMRGGNRRVIHIAAGFMIFCSIVGKAGAFFASIPLPVVAAMSCVQFAYVVSAGLGLLEYCKVHSCRSRFILGFSILMGISVPQFFRGYLLSNGHDGIQSSSTAFNNVVQVIFSSPATVAVIIAMMLDFSMSRGESSTREDSGRHWWEKFRNYETDKRSQKNYSLPCNVLDKLWPPV